ncbi:hypothetical protein A3715_15820 [Oleiphilus sp. HI0009]|nr:hypothetical protein A3715_15820 [Oleiphilus sp. HI0009]
MNANDEYLRHQLAESLKRKVREYAHGRLDSVKRGLESPKLSALLLEKYACGFAQAIEEIDRDLSSQSQITRLADELCLEIDPDFIENRKRRWDVKPSDLNF